MMDVGDTIRCGLREAHAQPDHRSLLFAPEHPHMFVKVMALSGSCFVAAIHTRPRLCGDLDLFVLFTALAQPLAHKRPRVQFN